MQDLAAQLQAALLACGGSVHTEGTSGASVTFCSTGDCCAREVGELAEGVTECVACVAALTAHCRAAAVGAELMTATNAKIGQ